MAVDIYSAMGRKKKKNTVDIYSAMGRVNSSAPTQTNNAQKVVGSATPTDNRTVKEKYTVNKTTLNQSSGLTSAKDPFKNAGKKQTLADVATTTPLAKTITQVDSINYNYLGSTPIEKLTEDKNNTDDFNKILYEAVTNDTADGKSFKEITNIASKNNGVTPKINTYTNSLGVLSGSDTDELISKFTEYDSLYKKAIAQIQKNGKVEPYTDTLVSRSIEALKKMKKSDSERTVASEYLSLLESVKNGDYGSYLASRYAQGSASGVIDGLNGIAITAKDVISKLTGNETESDRIKRIDDYFKQNPSDRSLIHNQGTAFLLANKIGVGVNDLQSYNFYTMTQRGAEDAEKKGNNLNENVKNIAGGIAETMGGFVTAKGVGTAFGAASATSTVIDNIKNKSGLAKTLKDLFKITPQNAVYGLGTAGSETVSLAQSRGYNPLNIITAAAKGYAETTAENIGGIEELKWFDDLGAGKSVGKAFANHLIDSVSEVGEEELTLVMQNLIDKTLVNEDRKWSGVGGVFDGNEMLSTAITSFAFGEIIGGVKLATDIKTASKNGKATEQQMIKAKKTLDYINDSLPEKYKQDISGDSADAAAQKIINAEIEYLKELDDKTVDNSDAKKAVDDIISSAVKTAAFSGGVTKQNMLDRMSQRGYTPSAVMDNVSSDNLLPEVKASLEQLTAKLDAEFASAWYADNGATAGRKAASVYLKANSIAKAVKSINLASDVASGKISGKSAAKTLTQAAALINSSSTDASAIIDTAASLIVSTNENTQDVSLDYASDLIDAVNNAMYEQGHIFDTETSKALTDMLFGGNITQKNLGYVLGDIGATKTLEKLLGMNIDEKTKVDTVKRKVRDMVNSYRAGQSKLFNFVASQKNQNLSYYDRLLNELGADEEATAGFKNALLNGELTESQAIAIASDAELFDLYVKATAGRLGTNPTLDDMIKAAGYVGGFDLAGDISPYYDKGYSETVESDTLVVDDETGVYDAGTGTVVLNKKAEPIKKLSYKLAQELLDYNIGGSTANVDEISVDMAETDRHRILNSYNIKLSSNEKNYLYAEIINKLHHKVKNTAEKIIYPLADKLGILNSEMSMPGLPYKVTLSKNNGLKKSLNQQIKYSGTYADFAKALINIDSIIENAILIEKHSDIYMGTVRENVNFENATVFLSILNDGDNIIPIVLEVKKDKTFNNGVLYVYTCMDKIKRTSVTARTKKTSNDVSTILTDTDSIFSLSEIFSKVNEKDVEFLKYIPDKFLSNSQKRGKQNGLDNRKKKINALPLKKRTDNSLRKNHTQTNVNTLVNSVIYYMSANGYDLDSEVNRVIKKFNPYILEHRSRLNSLLLSEQSLQREIAADFLTSVFSDETAMQKLADADLSLAVELAEQVKAFANSTSNGMMKDFANGVFGDLNKYIRTEDNSLELTAVLRERSENGQTTAAIDDSIDEDRINMNDPEEKTVVQKAVSWYNALKRGFVDSGEAIDRLAKKLDNKTIYHLYNNVKQAKQSISYMLEKAQTDIEGKEIGKSLKEIFKPIIANKKKYNKFCLYMQYLNNAERSVNDKAIFSDVSREESFRRAEMLVGANPEFEKWAEDVYKYNDGLMHWLIDSGLLSQDQYETMKQQNKYYVPAFYVDDFKFDKPRHIKNVVVKKTVKRARGGVETTMPLLDAFQLKTQQVITEAKLNVLAIEIVDTLKHRGMLEDTPRGLEVKDPALKEFVNQITTVKNSKYHEPEKKNGVYVTPITKRNLKSGIKELLVFSGKAEANKLINDYADRITLSETFNSEDAKTLTNELMKLAIVPGANADAPYYQYSNLRSELASLSLYVPPEVVNEIPDYNYFRKSSAFKLNLTQTKSNGVSFIDQTYQILSGAYSELFDPSIINSTDQLIQMHKVATETLKKPTEVTLKEYYGDNIDAFVNELTDNIIVLSQNAVSQAHDERTAITKDKEAHAFVSYDADSINNFAFDGEQDGNRMVFYVDGIRHTMDIGKGMYEGIKNISFDPDAKDALVPVQRAIDCYKRLITSYNPFFSVRNFSRDMQDAVLFSSDSVRMLKNIASGRVLKEIRKNGELWQLYQALGGVGSSYFDFKKQLDLETSLAPGARLKRGWDNATGVFENINQVVEQIPRFAEFITVLENEMKAAKIEKLSDVSLAVKQKAVYASADVTVNFGRSGVFSRFLNSTVIPFYNPGVQGLSRFVRLFTETKGAKKWIFLAGKLVAFGFMTGAVNDLINSIYRAFVNDEDDTYEQLTDHQKQNNILFPIGNGKYIKIPKGRASNVVGIGAQSILDVAHGRDVEWPGIIKTAFNQVWPNDPITDNIASAVVYANLNRTWYGGEIESKADENVAPGQRYDETTDYFSRWLGGVLNYSPKKINYILDAYSGVLGDYLLPIFTAKGSNKVFENVLLTAGDNFIVDGTTSNRISSDYYSLVDELTFEKNDVRNTDKTASSVALRFLNSQTKAVSELYKEIHSINGDTELSVNEKTSKIREAKATINGIMLNAIEKEREVYSLAENFESKYAYKKGDSYYDNEGAELTYDEYINVIYREINRKLFGADYALQLYNKDTYAKAVDTVKDGATFELYYDAYFDLKSIDGDIDFTKGTIKTGTERYNKWKYINSMDASRKEKSALAKNLLSIDNDKIKKARAAGVGEYDYIDFVCDTGSLKSDDNHTKKQKVLAYINRMNLSSREKDALYILAGYSTKTIYEVPWR